MARRRKKPDADQAALLEARVTTAPCVPGIRKKVKAWRDARLQGSHRHDAHPAELLVLHRPPPARWPTISLSPLPARSHRDARSISTKSPRRGGTRTSSRRFATERPGIYAAPIRRLRALRRQDGDRQRQDQGHVAGRSPGSSSTRSRRRATTSPRRFCLAPNVIVFERLRTDFEGGRIFRSDPIVPPELEIFWRTSTATCAAKASGQVRWARSI